MPSRIRLFPVIHEIGEKPVLNRDHFGRTVNYLRLSVTDRCNLRCCYCMPSAGVESCSHDEILRYEELLRIANAAVSLGIEKVRVTGGEPLVRKGILGFLSQLGAIPNLTEVTLTTNGLLLSEVAFSLKAAGVNRLNVSLDSLDPQTYEQITRGGDVDRVLAGLEAADQAGLRLKLNMVVMRGINDHEIERFADISRSRPWSVRFIEYMPTIREESWKMRIMSGTEVLSHLQRRFELIPLSNTRLCGPAKSYRIKNAPGTIGIITPMSDHFCGNCNRIRVTAQGLAKSCLLSDRAQDLKPAIAQGDEALRMALVDVIHGKEGRHHFLHEGKSFPMSCVGG